MKKPETPIPLPLRFDVIKFFCMKYPWVILKNRNGFVTIMRSKQILSESAYINTDLTTTWIEIIGIGWIEYFLIKMRIINADQL
jgi:hypothetical protein